ncbi:hypothetical protein [Natrinema soli]|uniref:Pectate lyase superfamily protein domain-containing protein n=1 Tax=Natrinema soli TaxID=1930624 RepID=A0ABD5SY67_9EURY|nr:hypothetical protein [Natrinema soli]
MPQKQIPDESRGEKQKSTSLARREWLKMGGTAIGASMFGLLGGVGTSTAATNTDIDLIDEVPDRAYRIDQEAPDDASDALPTTTASGYNNRSGDLTTAIENASQNGRLLELEPGGTYEMSSGVYNTGSIMGVVCDPDNPATIYLTGGFTEDVAWPVGGAGDDELVMQGIEYDISEVDDASILTTYGAIQEYVLIQDVTLRGQRAKLAEGGDAVHTFLVNVASGGEFLVRRVEFPDGGIEVPGEDGFDLNYAIPMASNRDHQGYGVWKDCYVAHFNNNGYYLSAGQQTGPNVLWDCVAENNARGNMRLGHQDVIVGGRSEVNSDYQKNEQPGTPVVNGNHEFDYVSGLTVIADSDGWGGAGIQTRTDAEGGEIRKSVLHFKSGNSLPIRVDSTAEVHLDMEDMWILDESGGAKTFGISTIFPNPGTLDLGSNVHVDSNANVTFRIGSAGELIGPDGTSYTSDVNASDVGVDANLSESDFPNFHFGDNGGSDSEEPEDSEDSEEPEEPEEPKEPERPEQPEQPEDSKDLKDLYDSCLEYLESPQ